MKKITLYILTVLLFSSCENMLDEVPKDFVSRANYYQNETDAQGALNGAYAATGPDFYGITYYLMVELHGDYLNGRGSQAPISIMDQVLNQQNIGRVASNWLTLYRAVNRANAVLNNVPDIVDISDEARSRIMAEAYFLRAMAYFELVRGWGPVPIKTKESTDLSELEAPRMPESDVYDLIIDDLTIAENDLPEDVGAETGKASKWAAKMLLSHVYLTLGDWTQAATKADDVIKSGKYSMVPVATANDFYKIFAAETSSEDIMSIHHSETSTSTIPTYLHRGSAYPYNNSSTGFFAWLPDMNSWIGDSWDTNDLRKQFNFYTEYQDADGNWVSLPSTVPVLMKKFINNADGLSIYSVPIYRFTEAYLFYAEAACQAAGSPSALALERLNMVKRRAYGYDPAVASPVDYPSGMSKEEFIETVLQERAYEFMIERRRWFDLKRTGKVKEAFAAVGKTILDERFLWPIPEDELNNNPAINQADQNPGY
ncbi:MAG: RagB/SusD family nutrient uptake outer membrane protein [Crocinitomicaceae bacterium]|nr:RagB/SusD family nutrient uptake outer membrane protein [Crocinitomicaceae bacterium]|tara:strand:- start:11346 stop:12800 length:1455 start_codon:yes stop_codon:yes gene_type:complete